MPKALSRRFTDKDRDKVEKFIEALLDYEKHRDKIQAEWTIGNPEPHHLVVTQTTKENLVRIIYNSNCAGQDLQKYKGYIQTAMAYLEEDLNILVRHSPKIGAEAKNLKFYLRLTSNNQDEIFRIFEEAWTAKRQELEARTTQYRENESKIEVEQGVVGVERDTIKWFLKFRGELDAIGHNQEKIRRTVIEITKDPRNKIVEMKKGCVIVEFEGSLEGFKRLESKIKSGEITEILGFPILEIQQIDELESSEAGDIGFKLTQWFDNIKIDDWLDEIGMQATRLVRRLMPNNNIAVAPLRGDPVAISKNNPLNILSKIPAEWLSEIDLDSSENTSNIFISLLNSSHLDWIKFIASELGDLTNIPAEVIETLATRITTIEDSETRWQLALTLGKLDPEHPLGAVGQTKTIEFPTDDWFDLFLALRVGEDDLIDVLIEVTSGTDEYLPVGLQVFLLDEAEEIFLEAVAKEEERYLSLEFTGAIGQFFSVKFSLEDSDWIENFVI